MGITKYSVIILAFALLSCSTASLVYSNAGWYLQHKINDYTSFNTRQKETIRQEVSSYINWHRSNALPEYIIFLQNLDGAAQYEGQLKVEAVTRLRAHLLHLYRKTMLPAIRPAAKLLDDLDSSQIEELGRSFAEESQKRKQELLGGSDDENLGRRAKKTIDFLEWLVGNLSEGQQQNIEAMSSSLPFISHIHIQSRESKQGRLIALLNGHAGTEQVAEFLSSWIFTPEMGRTSQQQQDMQAFEMASDHMIAQVHGLLTTRQKEHMHDIISGYIEDFQSLTLEMQGTSGTSR